MSTIPAKQTSETPRAETVAERFRRLEATWTAEVGHFSSPDVLRSHPAFQEIIGLGEAVVSLMLHDLEERPRLWVWALPEITETNPVPPADRGKIRQMTEAWLRWGKENGCRRPSTLRSCSRKGPATGPRRDGNPDISSPRLLDEGPCSSL
jgi:hypothetical protein